MSTVIHKFTRTVPEWRPRVKPLDLQEATAEQLEALKITPSNTKVSDYLLVLAHDPETLTIRSPLFNTVMYAKGGPNRAARELGALGASIVNQCIFCAAVHAQRHAQLSRDETVVTALFLDGENAKLPPVDQVMFDFSLKLSRCPPQVEDTDLSALREQGLDNGEVIDLVLSTAMFGWANRLMHVLGDPVK